MISCIEMLKCHVCIIIKDILQLRPMSLEAKPIHDELASRRPASDNRQGSGCGGMTLHFRITHQILPRRPNGSRTPVTCISNHGRPWQGRGSLPTGRPNPFNDPDGNRTLALLSRTAAACGKAAGPVLHAWLTGRLRQGRRRAREHPASAHHFPSKGKPPSPRAPR